MRSPVSVTLMIIMFFIIFSLLLIPHRNAPKTYTNPPKHKKAKEEPKVEEKPDPFIPSVSEEILMGDQIMPELGNATAKAELGRASWKLFHTTLGRFPKKPSKQEREALNSYLYLFARLYPCGECAKHFQALLSDYPPQTSSRGAASQWGCFVHNLVNERLKKPEFDCHTIASAYDCGCEEADKEVDKKEKVAKLRKELEELEREDTEEKKERLTKMLEEMEQSEKEEEEQEKKKKEEDGAETLKEKAEKAGVEVEVAGTVTGG